MLESFCGRQWIPDIVDVSRAHRQFAYQFDFIRFVRLVLYRRCCCRIREVVPFVHKEHEIR